jgi:hypothetical protein
MEPDKHNASIYASPKECHLVSHLVFSAKSGSPSYFERTTTNMPQTRDRLALQMFFCGALKKRDLAADWVSISLYDQIC